tara:strand:+ start:10034 stop:10441 length:408 start_codon:yes stop_codon:yes gene_type:complete
MISAKYLKRFNLKHTKVFSRKFILGIILCYFVACSNDYQIKNASWDSSLDYFSENLKNYEVTYFVDVGTKEAYVGGILEIYKLPNKNYLDRIKVTEIEFFTRVDGLKMCRIWGESSKSGTRNHLLARNCKDLTDL